MTITTDTFLAAVKRTVTVPNDQTRFSNADILAMGDEQMMILMLPMITSLRQEYFVRKEAVTLVADQPQYKIPYRSIGRTLRMIKIRDSAESYLYSIPYVVPEDTQTFVLNLGNSDAQGYTLEGDNIKILPTPPTNTDQVAELYYELAPSNLIETSEAGIVSSVDTVTGIITLEGAITGFETGQTMDIIDGTSGNTVIGLDLVNSDVTANTITFDPDDFPTAPDAITAGDYVALAQQTPVLQIPNEAFFVLVQAVAVKILEARAISEACKPQNQSCRKI